MSGAFLKCLSRYSLQSFCDCPSDLVEDLHQKVLSLLSGLENETLQETNPARRKIWLKPKSNTCYPLAEANCKE